MANSLIPVSLTYRPGIGRSRQSPFLALTLLHMHVLLSNIHALVETQTDLWTFGLIPTESSTSNILTALLHFHFLIFEPILIFKTYEYQCCDFSGPVLFLCSKGSKQPRRKLPLRSLPWLNGSGMATSLLATSETPRAKAEGHFQGGVIAAR